jgi:SAM-dependent methyltransferase
VSSSWQGWPWIAAAIAAAIALLAILYWQLVVAEGTYLGPRMVARTYDWIAGRYDAIKQFSPREESWFVAAPLLRALAGETAPLLLDVATGAGRLPMALLREHFAGRIFGLDLSLGMLRRALAKLRPFGDQVRLIWQDAAHLPFDDGVFDAVTCLESIEFFADPVAALAEMVRVLRPEGVLMVSNRVGWEARLLPRRAISRSRFEQELARLGLRDVQVRPWQVSYDLALARKEGQRAGGGAEEQALEALLRCPACAGKLTRSLVALTCPACARSYPLRDGIVCLAAR